MSESPLSDFEEIRCMEYDQASLIESKITLNVHLMNFISGSHDVSSL